MHLLKVNEGDTILEIGCGTGQSLLALARGVGESGRTIGVDLSLGMISQAEVKLNKSGVSRKVDLVCGDALQLPFEAGFCNAIFMSFALERFQPGDIGRVLYNCRRVLRAGGWLCVVAMAEKANPGLPLRVYKWANRKFPQFIDCRPIDVRREVSEAGFQLQALVEMELRRLPIQIVLAANPVDKLF